MDVYHEIRNTTLASVMIPRKIESCTVVATPKNSNDAIAFITKVAEITGDAEELAKMMSGKDDAAAKPGLEVVFHASKTIEEGWKKVMSKTSSSETDATDDGEEDQEDEEEDEELVAEAPEEEPVEEPAEEEEVEEVAEAELPLAVPVEEEMEEAVALPRPAAAGRTLTVQATEGMRVEVVHEGQVVTVVVKDGVFQIEDPSGLQLALSGS